MIHSSLLCGTSLGNHELSEPLKQQSLIHLFVVSGGHFLFLEKILRLIKGPQFCHIPLLLFYNFVTGFQAPGTRSVTQMMLSRSFFLNLREDQIQFLTGFLLLVLFPELGKSVSFLLSWTAALALSLSSFFFYSHSSLKKILLSQFLISGILFPWLWAFGNGHPLGILCNLVLGPVIVFILFPLSFIIVLFPSLSFLFDEVARVFTLLLAQSNEVFSAYTSRELKLDFFWIYLFGLHFLFHFYQVHYWRKST